MAIVVLIWMIWGFPFIIQYIRMRGSRAQTSHLPVRTAPGATRWGIVLEAAGILCAWTWPASPSLDPSWEFSGWVFGLWGTAIGWWALYHLSTQWRLLAAVTADHQLITTGPYRWIRHPIYASLLSILLMTLTVRAPGWGALVSLALYLLGTEVRISAEDRLLESRFGDEFDAYRRRTPAYVPFLR